MQNIRSGIDGLSLVMVLNWDRMLYLATITLALFVGAWLGTL